MSGPALRRIGASAVMPPALLALILLAGCDPKSERWLERQNAVDPPELWRVSVVGADARPVELCADTLLRRGFTTPLPEIEGKPCVQLGDPVSTGDGHVLRCKAQDRTLLVGVKIAGDPADFTVALNVQTLDRENHAVTQTRRYTRLGACPDGWRIGDNTDQQGRRRNNVWPPAWG